MTISIGPILSAVIIALQVFIIFGHYQHRKRVEALYNYFAAVDAHIENLRNESIPHMLDQLNKAQKQV